MVGAILLAATCVCGLDHEVVNERCESLWSGEDVKSETVSRPLSLGDFRSKVLYIAGSFGFHAEVDENGDGSWTKTGLKKRYPGIYDLKYLTGSKFRLVADRDATNVTVVVNCANPSSRRDEESRKGGPWNSTVARAHVPSEPFSIHGFDVKYLDVSSDNDAKIDIELDINGKGAWIPFRTFKTAKHLNISNIRAYRLRAVADRDCKATVQLEYK